MDRYQREKSKAQTHDFSSPASSFSTAVTFSLKDCFLSVLQPIISHVPLKPHSAPLPWGKVQTTYLDPTLMSVCMRKIPFSCNMVCARPITRITSSHDPSAPVNTKPILAPTFNQSIPNPQNPNHQDTWNLHLKTRRTNQPKTLTHQQSSPPNASRTSTRSSAAVAARQLLAAIRMR